jgi:hypothetical protein
MNIPMVHQLKVYFVTFKALISRSVPLFGEFAYVAIRNDGRYKNKIFSAKVILKIMQPLQPSTQVHILSSGNGLNLALSNSS